MDAISRKAWLSDPAAPEASVRLFCLPFAGGSAAIYRNWPALLAPDVDCRPVHLPGRERRFLERPYDRLEPLADALTDGIAGALDRPFALFGHSMGALLAFETARRLRRRGLPEPALLIVSARHAPSRADRADPLHALPRAELVAGLRRLGGTPEEVLEHEELMDFVLPVLRADFAVCETHRHREEAPLACPILAIAGRGDRRAPPAEMAGWERETSGWFQFATVEGGHFFLGPCQEQVLGLVTAAIARTVNGRRPPAEPPTVRPAPPHSAE